jgi:hypothetical protein
MIIMSIKALPAARPVTLQVPGLSQIDRAILRHVEGSQSSASNLQIWHRSHPSPVGMPSGNYK